MATTNVACKYDTFIISGNGSASNDASASLNIFPLNTIAFFQFDIPVIEEITLNSAKLFFYINERGRNMALVPTLYDVKTALSGLTYNIYNSQISDKAVLDGDKTYACGSTQDYYFNQWVSIDITNLVIGHMGESNYTLSLKAKATGSQLTRTVLKSKEAGYAAYIQLDYSYATPFAPTIIFPNGDTVLNSGILGYQWNYNSSGTTPQKKFDLQWKMQADTEWNEVSEETENTFYEIDASIFVNGIVEWRVRTYNSRDMVSDWAESQFVVVGRPGNPEIKSVKNDAITEIAWIANKSEESAARIKIIKDSRVIYDSGEIPAGIKDSHRPNMILDNGSYSALLSISNMYGMWSNEVSYNFTIDNVRPEKTMLTAEMFGDCIKLSFTEIEGASYFVYRAEEDGGFVPIAKTETAQYFDYAVKPDCIYQYFIRTYKLAYSDSDKVSACVAYSGFFVSAAGNMEKRVQLRLHDSEAYIPVNKTISNSSALILYVGREKPVKESGRFKSRIVEVECYMNRKNFAELKEIYDTNGIYCLRSREGVMYCDIGSIRYSNRFFNLGYLVGLTFEEVHYEEAVRFDE